ncbi:MAG TPA: plasma-membrane proton-efflux P-type ATPase [Dehalococcoidia bacterium]|nr:plasma-membrane proton-efflux P-type ATPase [Dehalococcoidia bacterium]
MTEPAKPPADQIVGLASEEARARFQRFGPNEVTEERTRPWLAFLAKFWAPVPWMLESTIVLELIMQRAVEALVISMLLLLNAVVSFVQESRAHGAVRLLRQQLAVQSRVLRDGHWQLLPARFIVPGDVIHVRNGDFVPADASLLDGSIQVDLSTLTGESAPVEVGPGGVMRAGAVVRHGEATAEVTATGSQTYFGRTAELVKSARPTGHLEGIILKVVRYLVAIDLLLVLLLFVYAIATNIPLKEVLPFSLVLMIASVPVALPATFTLAVSLGALEMSRAGVIVTRLSAIEEAAGMEILCVDKTGTITENRLSLAEVRPLPGLTADQVLRYAALASDDSTQDPIDLAILDEARRRQLLVDGALRTRFVPFDPATKQSEAFFSGGDIRRSVKGAPLTLAQSTTPEGTQALDKAESLAKDGSRVLGVAIDRGQGLEMAGFLALHDPVRSDSVETVRRLHSLGIRVIMVTGDTRATAMGVAEAVGIGSRPGDVTLIREDQDALLDTDVFAGVFPEDKFHLVQALQRRGHIAGMTGDGVNDAPALRQAEVGIAVASATDVAKDAASLVLTSPGLSDLVEAVNVSRRIYQRMLTYTLNKIIKTLQVAFFLTFGLILLGDFVTTPRLVILLLFANDFVTMAVATDRVSPSRMPDRWQVRSLIISGLALAGLLLLFSFAVFLLAGPRVGSSIAELQTLVFVMLVFTGQATLYVVRERGHFWSAAPSNWLLMTSLVDIVVVSLLATQGWLMTRVPIDSIAAVLGLALLYLIVADTAKVQVFRRLRIA